MAGRDVYYCDIVAYTGVGIRRRRQSVARETLERLVVSSARTRVQLWVVIVIIQDRSELGPTTLFGVAKWQDPDVYRTL